MYQFKSTGLLQVQAMAVFVLKQDYFLKRSKNTIILQ